MVELERERKNLKTSRETIAREQYEGLLDNTQ